MAITTDYSKMNYLQRRKSLAGSTLTNAPGVMTAFGTGTSGFSTASPNTATASPTIAPNYSLPENYGFNDLAGYEQNKRTAFGNNVQEQIGKLKTGIQSQYDTALQGYKDTTAQRRSALASSLSDTAKNTFEMNNPYILEDLNSRGVFSSPTAVATAQAQALKELDLANQDKLSAFDASSQSYEDQLSKERLGALSGLDESGVAAKIQAEQDALDSALDLRRGKLEGDLQSSQANKEEALARDLAKQQGRNQLTNSLIGVGGGLGSALLLSKGAGLFKGGTTATTPTVAASTPAILGGTTTGTLGGTAYAGAGVPASALFPGGLGSVGTATGPVGATGSGIGIGGGAAIGGAGIGAALLSRAAQNKVAGTTGSNSLGSIAGVVANPIGAQLNVAKGILTNPKKAISNISGSLGLGAGKTADGNAIADASRSVQATQQQLQELKDAASRGEISQEEYLAQAQPVVEQTAQLVGQVAGRGSVYANAINKVWQDFQNAGLARNTGNGFVAV